MRHLLVGLLAILSASISVPAVGQGKFELSGQAYRMQWPAGKWNGKHAFPNVYCTTFPTPEKALNLRHAFFNGGAIYLTDVVYPDKLFAVIAVSTVPSSQSSEEALEKILNNERKNEAELRKAGLGYSVSELPGDFGPTVGIVAKNPTAGDENGPFPLTRSFITNPKQPIVSLSVHRLFVRGHDRFELAVLQLAPQPSTETTEAEMTARLTAMADEMVQSLQKCTASIPVRAPK
ncbi:hypothetical protein SKTS_28680 [Sulfurimicrobium lacus]|uniref:DUF3313 domain-containing protein n=1 Tax=Sulfurimicrobium lacus TaxID=2715678 RepID=A0A6F8VGA7_9PROT|nr:hypothetical protein [Sulfurimicrobium lacus]BCB27982.1 hypothetical protein SKTS_28680 [Sulfurimicrobium lacus]